MSHRMDPFHPGEHLAEFLAELGISQYRLAKEIHVPPRRINEIVHGKRAITADTVLRLGHFSGLEPGFWMNLQTRYDMERAAEALGCKPKLFPSGNSWEVHGNEL